MLMYKVFKILDIRRHQKWKKMLEKGKESLNSKEFKQKKINLLKNNI